MADMADLLHVTLSEGTPREWNASVFQWGWHGLGDVVASGLDLFGIAQAIRNMAAYFWYTYPEQRPQGFETPGEWASSVIGGMLSAGFGVLRLQSGGTLSGLVEAAALACAMGNPAACGVDIPTPPVQKRLK